MIAYSDTAVGIAEAAVAAGIVPADARHAIERAALGAAAEYVARGVDVSGYTYAIGPDPRDRDAVQLLFMPPWSDDPAPLRYMLDGLEPGSDLYCAIAGEDDGRIGL